jgi:hypothetical protein
MNEERIKRDIIVIGASIGSVKAVKSFLIYGPRQICVLIHAPC